MISQEEWDALPQEEKNRRTHELKRSIRHILESHGKEVVIAALKSILEDMKEEEPPPTDYPPGTNAGLP